MNMLHFLVDRFFLKIIVPRTLLLLLTITVLGSSHSTFSSNHVSFSKDTMPVISKPKNILVLFSYHRAEWSDNVQKGIESVLGPYQNVHFFYEYMDTKRLKSREYFETLRKIYTEKYGNANIDLVISVDNNALDLLVENAYTFLPGTPVVFCGVNDYKPSLHSARPGVTGVVEYGDFADTLKIAFRARPNAQKLYIICDQTETGKINTRELITALSTIAPGIQAILTDQMSYKELSTTIQDADPQEVAFFVSFWKDGTGMNIESWQLDVIFRESPIPVFGRSEWMINHGMVGGKCVTGFAQGEAAARFAAQVLGGTPVSALPVDTKSPNQYLYDYQVMRHYLIDEDIFPDKSIGFNRPDSFFRISRTAGTIVLVFSLLLLAALVFLVVNIHLRRKAEKALRESESRYRGMIENIQDTFYRTDAQGVLIFISSSGARLLGYDSPQEMIGRPTASLWNFPEKRQTMLETMKKQDGVVNDYEVTLVRKDGSPIPVSTTSSYYYDKDAQILGVEGIFRDIADRKRSEEERLSLEKQLLHAQKLESLGILAGGIAHDFNNLLTAIMGNADLALMRLNPESPVFGNLQNIEKATVRAADLAKQMLAYSGKGKFVVENLDLNLLLKEMVHMLEVSISKKAVLHFNQDQPLPQVEADATQMRQIIMNLVINASEAIGDKSGVISITTGCMDCNRSYLQDDWLDVNISAGHYVFLDIADTGCGMDKKTMAKLFDPFFTTKFTGRGLGMAAVLGIVRGHKGAIKVYSEVNNGTSFKVLLPVSGKPAELFNRSNNTDDWKGRGTVLLVDDEESVRDIGVEMLKALGFKTITANDGLEAVEQFQNSPAFSFVILDLTMPHMDGEQCFRELRQLQPNIKVIMSSGFSEGEVTQKFVGKGLSGFIQKPYKLSVLKEAIKEVIE